MFQNIELKIIVCIIAIVLPAFGQAQTATTKNPGSTYSIGGETDFPAFWFGSYAPGGLVSVMGAIKGEYLTFRTNLGMDLVLDTHVSIALEGNGGLFAKDLFSLGWNLDPAIGLNWVYSQKYQRMTDKTRNGPNDETLDTYIVADHAHAFNGFGGLNLSQDVGNNNKINFGLGYIKQVKFFAKNLHKEEIRNCYADDCPDSNKSGGGSWPAPEESWYLKIGWEYGL